MPNKARVSISFPPFLILVLLWWLIFWGESWEAQLNMDAMTYSALAKHILSTGDWKTLHYAEEAYSNFYQHPPFGMWALAVVFKIFGPSEFSAKLLPALLALADLGLVYHWGRRIHSEWCGFLAGFILIFSTRFIKYGALPLLDVFLAFFLLLGGTLIIGIFDDLKQKQIWKFPLSLPLFFKGLGLGTCLALAFLSKGMPAFSLLALFPILIGTLALEDGGRFLKRGLIVCGVAVTSASAILALWLLWGDGVHYLQRYWEESVKARLSNPDPSSWFFPFKNLFKTYWPWLPFYLFASICFASQLLYTRFRILPRALPLALASFASWGLLAGFSITGHFLEHYHVPFYPFAALCIAALFAPSAQRYEQPFQKFLLAIGGIYALLLAAFPLHVQGDYYREPRRLVLKRATQECDPSKIERIYLQDRAYDRWFGLAAGLWFTPWDAAVISELKTVPTLGGRSLLVLKKSESIPPGWETTAAESGDYRVLQPVGGKACQPQ